MCSCATDLLSFFCRVFIPPKRRTKAVGQAGPALKDSRELSLTTHFRIQLERPEVAGIKATLNGSEKRRNTAPQAALVKVK